MGLKVSQLIGKTVEIDQSFMGDFYYEFEHGGQYNYDFLDENHWKGIVMDVSSGMETNIVVLVGGKKYFELIDMEVMLDGVSLDELVDEWDWSKVESKFSYDDYEDGMEY